MPWCGTTIDDDNDWLQWRPIDHLSSMNLTQDKHSFHEKNWYSKFGQDYNVTGDQFSNCFTFELFFSLLNWIGMDKSNQWIYPPVGEGEQGVMNKPPLNKSHMMNIKSSI